MKKFKIKTMQRYNYLPKVLCLKAFQPVIVKKILQHFVVEFNDKCFVDFWVDFVAFWQASQ